MTAPRMRAVGLAALVCGAGVVALLQASDHQDSKAVWAVFGPVVGWSFIGVGLYAWRRRPESRTGALMVLLGFAWFLSALAFANSRLLYSAAFVIGGLWGGVFLHLVMAFPSGRLAAGRDRALVVAGYLVFTVASVPAMLFAGPHELGCDGCPTNVLLIHRDPDPEDGRASLLVPTAAGIERMDRHRRRRGQAIAPIVADWAPEDVSTLLDLLRRYIAGLDEHRDLIVANMAGHQVPATEREQGDH